MYKKTIIIMMMTAMLLVIGGVLVITTENSQKTMAAPAPTSDPVNDACNGEAKDSPFCKSRATPVPGTDDNPITKTIGKAVQLFALIGGVVAVIWIIYGGFKFVMSDGDSGRIEEARKTILYGVIGLVVMLSAQILVTFILNAVIK